ncbi:MAG: hypothetical protein M3445_10030 [Actinomycetota bacterium]|nr:hypothetical protein [Actinomycetota bacterium]
MTDEPTPDAHEVDRLVAPIHARREAIRTEIAKLREQRARTNEQIRMLVADEVRLARIVRAGQPRKPKGAAE